MTRQETKAVIKQLIQELGRFPKINEIAAALSINKYQTQKLLKGLVNDGFLTMQSNWYRLAPAVNQNNVRQFPTFPASPESLKNEVESPKEKGLKEEEPVKQDWTISLLRTCMGFVGVGATLLSLYYTYVWQAKMLPWFLAFILSAIMVTFSVFAFEIVLLFASNEITDKPWKWAVVFIFSILWVIVVSYSITTTIAGQYDEHITKLKTETIENLDVNVDRSKWDLIQEEKNELKTRIQEKRDDIIRYKSMLPTAEEIEADPKKQKIYNTNHWLIASTNREIDGYNAKLEEQRLKEEELLAKNPKATEADEVTGKTPNFFRWVAERLKLTPEIIQFFMSLFPAVFIDIIAPAALAVALFLRRKRKNPRN